MQQYDKIAALLIKRFTREELTSEELAYLEDWIQQNDKYREYIIDFNDPVWVAEQLRLYGEQKDLDLKKAWEKMEAMGWERIQAARIIRMRRVVKYVIGAAAVFLFLLIGTYLIRKPKQPEVPLIVKDAKQDAKPTTQKAILTLDNGQTIVLDSLQNGLLATQGSTQVLRDKNGVLRYSHEKNNHQQLIYNKVTVPKGGDVVYLQLSEGTKVWLNAESSIRYPVAFSEDERKVEITGEAYFEVTKSQTKKFIVGKGSMNVMVLGTKFNVNTYDNEDNIKVTLLEGSVKVQTAQSERTIKPGEQAVVKNTSVDVITDIDVGMVMAWKAGKFVFNNTNIQLIMRQMERWYDLEKTEFKSNSVKELAFNGAISRYNYASKVLELLEEAGSIHFTIQGKKVILSK
ncbi:FecR family protein [Niastella sp. OAS944]|uniref:FecR family protein n=1 Tax=Niastella sp. OAS944 TaxID=2664089 RepID=UPI003478AC9C|nr:hypothetical protein [Chitinophagaceae bacterium OAS944]